MTDSIALALGADVLTSPSDPFAPDADVKEDLPVGATNDDPSPPNPKASLAAPHGPPGRRLLTREQVLIKCGLSDSTLRRRMRSGLLPRPVELGNRYCLRWFADEIDAALVGLSRQQPAFTDPNSAP
jgi:predicted DNA-binding transcriptional regulator AlpA